MTHLLLLLSLIPAALSATAKADYEICLYPKRCAPKAAVTVAQFQPCVWPNPCAGRRSETVVL